MANLTVENLKEVICENVEIIRNDFDESFNNDWYKFRSIKIGEKTEKGYNVEFLGFGSKTESSKRDLPLSVLEITLMSWFKNYSINKQ